MDESKNRGRKTLNPFTHIPYILRTSHEQPSTRETQEGLVSCLRKGAGRGRLRDGSVL